MAGFEQLDSAIMEAVRRRKAQAAEADRLSQEESAPGSDLGRLALALTSGLVGGARGGTGTEISSAVRNQALAAQEGKKKARLAALGRIDDEISSLTGLAKLRAENERSAERLAQQGELERLKMELKRQELDNKKAIAEAAKAAKMPSKEQTDAAGFAERLAQSEKIFTQLAQAGETDPTGAMSWLERSAFFPEFAKRDATKLREQAERNYINAVLRRESGAAISPDEFTNARLQYFPQAGDPEQLLAQKAENRRINLAALRAGAGPAAERLQAQLALTPAYQGNWLPIPGGGAPLVPEALAGQAGGVQTRVKDGITYKKVPGGWAPL